MHYTHTGLLLLVDGYQCISRWGLVLLAGLGLGNQCITCRRTSGVIMKISGVIMKTSGVIMKICRVVMKISGVIITFNTLPHLNSEKNTMF